MKASKPTQTGTAKITVRLAKNVARTELFDTSLNEVKETLTGVVFPAGSVVTVRVGKDKMVYKPTSNATLAQVTNDIDDAIKAVAGAAPKWTQPGPKMTKEERAKMLAAKKADKLAKAAAAKKAKAAAAKK